MRFLNKGMHVKDKYGEQCKFIKYVVNGIHVEHPYKDFIFYDDIVYNKQFIV